MNLRLVIIKIEFIRTARERIEEKELMAPNKVSILGEQGWASKGFD